MAQRLAQQQLPGLIIWVLADNPACQFYAALGGVYLRDKTITIGGTSLREVAYVWEDAQRLMAQ